MIQKVSDNPLTYSVDLEDGLKPGRWEAAVYFASAFTELKRMHPGTQFQFVPFEYAVFERSSALRSILVVAL